MFDVDAMSVYTLNAQGEARNDLGNVLGLYYAVFTKNFSDRKPTGPVNHKNPQAQILFC